MRPDSPEVPAFHNLSVERKTALAARKARGSSDPWANRSVTSRCRTVTSTPASASMGAFDPLAGAPLLTGGVSPSLEEDRCPLLGNGHTAPFMLIAGFRSSVTGEKGTFPSACRARW